MSYSSKPIAVIRSSPYFSAVTIISSLITPSNNLLSARIAFNSLILCISSAYSASNFSRSKPVRARSLISTIACACTSVKPNLSIKFNLASAVVRLPRIILITSSMLSSAMIKPCKMWALSSALFKSYLVRLVITSF